jgi:drug/metabolite transporter (DMT)-like permease
MLNDPGAKRARLGDCLVMERRVSAVDAMLLGTVRLRAPNLPVTRYLVTHGFRPLAYASNRYLAATSLFWGFTWRRERSFRVRLSDGKLIGLAAFLIFLFQLCFVTAIDLTTASTVGPVLRTTRIFVGLTALVVGLERVWREPYRDTTGTIRA